MSTETIKKNDIKQISRMNQSLISNIKIKTQIFCDKKWGN